jgi:adenosylcobinamide-GDP ribazoletransferase
MAKGAGAIRAAFAFLTRLPVGARNSTERELAWAPAHFPLVGTVLGAALACAWLAARRTGALPSAVLVIALSMLLTGALHEDGLADTADALGGARTREDLMRILKDSRIGAFGAAALAVVVLFRVATLTSLDARAPAALVAVHAVARVAPVWLMLVLPYVSGEGAKSRAIARVRAPQALVATAWAAIVIALLARAGQLTLRDAGGVAIAVLTSTAACGLRFHARAGGVTGDLLGAAEQIAECACLFALAWTGAAST